MNWPAMAKALSQVPQISEGPMPPGVSGADGAMATEWSSR
jgi:hypothetical protein